MEKGNKFCVTMFGGFLVEYQGRTVTFDRQGTTKTSQLLQIVLQAGKKGILRERLLEQLFDFENLSSPNGSLRITIFRLRKELKELGFPELDYIVKDNGIYFWNQDIPVKIDTEEFTKNIKKAKKAASIDEKKRFYSEALSLYKGEFLPALRGVDWVEILNMQYRNMYFEAVLELCEILKKQKEYDKLLAIAKKAAKLYPFDEWELITIETLISLNRYDEAVQIYKNTTKLLFEELGVTPSDKFLAYYEKLNNYYEREESEFTEIKQTLAEEECLRGAYFCSYPSFRESYRYIRRLVERTGQSAYLMTCTIVDDNGYQMKEKDRLSGLSKELKCSVQTALRKCDMYSQYSPSQFVMLLMEIKQEECSIVMSRIDKEFRKNTGLNRGILKYQIAPVSEVYDTKKIFPER